MISTLFSRNLRLCPPLTGFAVRVRRVFSFSGPKFFKAPLVFAAEHRLSGLVPLFVGLPLGHEIRCACRAPFFWAFSPFPHTHTGRQSPFPPPPLHALSHSSRRLTCPSLSGLSRVSSDGQSSLRFMEDSEFQVRPVLSVYRPFD